MTRSPARELTNRILDLIPAHPEILNIDDAWGLFKVPGFRCDDLGPSLSEADAALSQAKAIHIERMK